MTAENRAVVKNETDQVCINSALISMKWNLFCYVRLEISKWGSAGINCANYTIQKMALEQWSKRAWSDCIP